MPNYKARSGDVLLYDSGTLTDNSSNTFTPAVGSLTKVKYKSFYMKMSGLTAAQLEMQMIIDGNVGSIYAAAGYTQAGNGDRTSLQEAAQVQFPLIEAGAILAASAQFQLIATFDWTDSDLDSLIIRVNTFNVGSYLTENIEGVALGALSTDSTITSILIETSTSDWTGSWQFYGVPR